MLLIVVVDCGVPHVAVMLYVLAGTLVKVVDQSPFAEGVAWLLKLVPTIFTVTVCFSSQLPLTENVVPTVDPVTGDVISTSTAGIGDLQS
jgi:hypothetical protein